MSNKLKGMIPLEILQLWNLQILDLLKNNLTGKLPTNFSGLQTMINQSTHFYLIGYNYYIANLLFGNVIDLFNKGQQMQYLKMLSIFTVIDLSDNQLTDKIHRRNSRLHRGYAYMKFICIHNLLNIIICWKTEPLKNLTFPVQTLDEHAFGI